MGQTHFFAHLNPTYTTTYILINHPKQQFMKPIHPFLPAIGQKDGINLPAIIQKPKNVKAKYLPALQNKQ